MYLSTSKSLSMWSLTACCWTVSFDLFTLPNRSPKWDSSKKLVSINESKHLQFLYTSSNCLATRLELWLLAEPAEPLLSLKIFSNFVMAIRARSMLAAKRDLMLDSSKISLLLMLFTLTECSDSVSQDSPVWFPSSSEAESSSLSSQSSPSSLSYSPIWNEKFKTISFFHFEQEYMDDCLHA